MHNLKEPHYIYISRDITSFKENRLHIQSFEEQQEQEIQQRVHQVIGQNQQLTDTNLFLEAFLEGALTYLDAHLKEETLVNLPTINLLLAKAKEVMDYQKDASKLLREIDAKAIFMEVKNALNPSLKATKAEIRYSFGQHRKLRYVKAHLYEIIYILLDNAIQYRKSDQPLTVFKSNELSAQYCSLLWNTASSSNSAAAWFSNDLLKTETTKITVFVAEINSQIWFFKTGPFDQTQPSVLEKTSIL